MTQFVVQWSKTFKKCKKKGQKTIEKVVYKWSTTNKVKKISQIDEQVEKTTERGASLSPD